MEKFIWIKSRPAADNLRELGQKLASGDLYVLAKEYQLIQLMKHQSIRRVTKSKRLDALIKDRLDAKTDDGKDLPKRDLNVALESEIFLQQFPKVDQVTRCPLYLPGWELTTPGYNDGGGGFRILYLDERVEPADDFPLVRKFLDIMDFKQPADQTNAVALALTILLRNHWPGAKPLGAILGNKSHCGKDTIRNFTVGQVPSREISWESTDWPVQQAAVKALRNPDVGVLSVGNVRSNGKPITSAFLERFITDPDPLMDSTKTNDPRRMVNRIVVTMTANQGMISQDLLNRAVVIRLQATGNVRERETEIGNPREEFLPQHQEQIEAELHGMIARWRDEGCPLDDEAEHGMSGWARTIGGILQVNGFEDFLGNQEAVQSAQEQQRKALGILGAARPDEWLRPGDWVSEMEKAGLVRRLIPSVDRENFESKRRRLGQVLSPHEGEKFQTETTGEILTLRLLKCRRRWDQGREPYVKYKFEVVGKEALPLDDENHEPRGIGAQNDKEEDA